MKNIFANIATVALFSSTGFATANFSGHWMANQGSVSGLESGTCSKIEIVITQNASGLTTQKYDAECGTSSSNWGPVTEDIQGGRVFEQGEQVGTIDDSQLLTTSPDSGVEYAYNLLLKQDAQGHPLLQTYYGVHNALGSIVIEGTLSKLNP